MARSHSTSSDDGRRSRKRARIACCECRQAKIRCGLESVPCPRCRKIGLECTVDPSYRRANRHDKVRELQQQLEELQNSTERQQHDTPRALSLSLPQKSQQNQQPLNDETASRADIVPVDQVPSVAALAGENPSFIPAIQARPNPSLGCGSITHSITGEHHAFLSTTPAEIPDGESDIITNSAAVYILETTRVAQKQVKAMFATWV